MYFSVNYSGDATDDTDLTSSEMSSDFIDDNISEEEGDEAVDSSTPEVGQPLYDGSQISTTTSNILLMTYAKKFNLTQDGFKALIDLIRVHCPKENNCVSTVYKLKSFFRELLSDDGFQTKQVKYCSICQRVVPEHKTACDVPECSGRHEPLISFEHISIKSQLRKLLQG